MGAAVGGLLIEGLLIEGLLIVDLGCCARGKGKTLATNRCARIGFGEN